MSLAIISHSDCLLHDTGDGHPERKERVAVIQDALNHYPFKIKVTHYDAPLATIEQLYLAHDKSYVDWIYSIAPEDHVISIDADTLMSPGTLQAAIRAAGAVCFAVDLICANRAKAVFCNVRPPGHHAEKDKAMGFCLFNNVAIGVRYAMWRYQLKRIVIIDFDVHHGNGTQQIFQRDENIMYCSSFQHPFYPGYDEEMDNNHIISVPLPAGTTSHDFRKAVADAWFERIETFKPELIFFSAGFDAHQRDPLAQLNLVKEDYVWLTKEIMKIAKKHCDGKVISVLEGGYDLGVLKECVPSHAEALMSIGDF